jgi:hypothetical protein
MGQAVIEADHHVARVSRVLDDFRRRGASTAETRAESSDIEDAGHFAVARRFVQ